MPAPSSPPGQARLESRAAIQDLIYRWCRGIDRLDFDAIRAVFHPDAHDDHIFYAGGVDGLLQALQERHRHIACSTHQVGNLLVEFVDDALALAETYVSVIQRFRDAADPAPRGSRASIVWCRYVDRMECRSGAWKIARRTLVIDAVQEFTPSEPAHRLPPAGRGNLGRRDTNDPLMLERARLDLA